MEGDSISSPLDDSAFPVLYTHTLCPYAHRAWLTLLEKVRSLLCLAGLFFYAVFGMQCPLQCLY